MNLPKNYTIQHMNKSVEISFCKSDDNFVFLPWTGYQILASIDGEPAAFLKAVVVERDDYNQFLKHPIWFRHFEGRFSSSSKYFSKEFQNNQEFNLIINEAHFALNSLMSFGQKNTITTIREQSSHSQFKFYENYKNNIDFINRYAQDTIAIKQLGFYLHYVNRVSIDFCESYYESDTYYSHYGATSRHRENRIDFSEYQLEKLLLVEATKFENSRGRPLYQDYTSKAGNNVFNSFMDQKKAFITSDIKESTNDSKILSSRRVIDFRENAQEIVDQTFNQQKDMIDELELYLNQKEKISENEFYQKLIKMNLF